MRDVPDKVRPEDRSPFKPTDAVSVRLPRWALALIVEALDEAAAAGSAKVAAVVAAVDGIPPDGAVAELGRSIQLLKLADQLRGRL